MTREQAIGWLKVINTKEFGWDEFALQESQREIRERCEQGVREAIDMAIEALQDRPMGEWIFNTDENNGKSWNICSVCGYSIFHTTNFCPNCGARMKGGND